ncbi:MAG TPA: glycosyltransferase family 2 protein, partial [Anaerolineae bacterium]|nr:glycosyltransferase family 2 protein [Anaerolineae bacterium]HIQ05155.1 glycosyltransferase family 2 protein [Anaerolineae bacterium]
SLLVTGYWLLVTDNSQRATSNEQQVTSTEHRAPGTEIIVVDNGSSDGTPEMVAQAFPLVRLIRNRENRGFAAACNQGFAVARGRYLMLLNPDTVVHPGAPDALLACVQADPMVGLVGPRILGPDGRIDYRCARRLPTPMSEFWEWAGVARRFPDVPFLGHNLMYRWDHRSDRDVEMISGVCMLMPRAVWEQVGPLDEGYFMYGEDADYCRRVAAAGYRIHYCADAVVEHRGGASSIQQPTTAATVEALWGVNRYFRRHLGGWAALYHRSLMALVALVKSGGYGIAWLVSRGERRRLDAQVRLHGAWLRWALGFPVPRLRKPGGGNRGVENRKQRH